MSSRFDEFFRDHREEFDDEEPRPQVWDGILKELDQSSTARIVPFRKFRWIAAASVILAVALGGFYLWNRNGTVPDKSLSKVSAPSGNPDIISDIDPGLAKEVYHFTQLIELKQEELKTIERDHPDLYREFMTDIDKLDSSYNSLKKELPTNPNREQLLEAMIQNLQLQTELLNRQLQIIQQIKQSKNKRNESNGKMG